VKRKYKADVNPDMKRKPACYKKGRDGSSQCHFLRTAVGVLNLNEKEESKTYCCTLGQFNITHKIWRLPKACKARKLKSKEVRQDDPGS